jgi:hypothetical protein
MDEPVEDFEKWVLEHHEGRMYICDGKTSRIQRWREKKVSLHKQCRFVEESLANAFVLRQNFGDRLIPLQVFINRQTEAYKCGLNWHLGLRELLDMASEWRHFKSKLIGLEDTSQQEALLTQLIERLKKSGIDPPFKL